LRISDLSRQSGVSVPTLKFYLRQGLLPPGTATARNQAVYDDRHLRRVRLVRTFTGIGGLELAAVRDILAAIDDPQVPLAATYEVVNQALTAECAESRGSGGVEDAGAEVDALACRLDWQVAPAAPGRKAFAQVLAALGELGCELEAGFFIPFARAAEVVVSAELDLLPADGHELKSAAVVRRVLFSAALAALCEIAHADQLQKRFTHCSPGP
jgi:DNA-binding transcriptional MerR regulator